MTPTAGDQVIWRHPVLKRLISGEIKRLTDFNIYLDNEEFGTDWPTRTPGSISRARLFSEQRCGRLLVMRHKPLPQPTDPATANEVAA